MSIAHHPTSAVPELVSSSPSQDSEGVRRWARHTLFTAVMATVGFVLTFVLIVIESSPDAVFVAAVLALGSLTLEVHLLGRLP